MNVENNKTVNYNETTQNTALDLKQSMTNEGKKAQCTSDPDKNQRLTYTVQEIAEILGISAKSAYKLVNSGQFSCKRIGRILRISRASFNQWLDAGDPFPRKELS